MAQQTDTIQRTDIDTNEDFEIPKDVVVVMHNDEVTHMDYVIFILVNVFGYSQEKAINFMFTVHNGERGVVGSYPYEIAETKVNEVDSANKLNGAKLKVSIEEE
ncbi:MAG: ATP-dependent Clp protease adaptor ClpS [Sphingobium sp.]|nr:ATP-dependent Clp protease adaptor ClpS [Sphingobium sp.]MBS50055.1 ATP-dependent Clp protease adaptor ClpS [Sphingobium sp.]